MTLLSPWTLAIAAAIFLPPLLALYMLRLRRRPLRVASTLLWRSAYEDLQANVPFQRLRWSLLLVLQVAALLLIAAALGRPTAPSEAALGGRTVVLIDVGASMQMVDDPSDGRTRLERAVAAVDELIGRLPTGSQMMIVTYGSSPTIRSGYESNPTMLRAALRSVVQTDETSDLAPALQVAEPFTRPAEEDEEPPATILIFTDGHVLPPRDRDRFEVAAAALREIRIGPSPDDAPGRTTGGAARHAGIAPNLGIVALDGRRRDDEPAIIELFTRLLWTGNTAISVPVTIEVHEALDRLDPTAAEAEPTMIRRLVEIPGATNERPGEFTLIEPIAVPESALIVVRHAHLDPFDVDDVAVLVMPPPRALRIALVAPEGVADPFLRGLLAETDPASLETLSATEWAAIDEPADRFDVVVLDRVDAPRWPSIASISFGAVPPETTRQLPRDAERTRGRRVLGWNRAHPLLRHADIGDLVFAGFSALQLPENADAVALGPDGPIIAVARHAGLRHVIVGFSLLESTLPILPGFPIFMQNAIDLVAGEAGSAGLAPRTGEALRVRLQPGTQGARLIDVDATRTLAIASATSTVAVPAATRAGVRRLETVPTDRAELPGGLLPASLLSETESDLRVPPHLELVATAVPLGGSASGRTEWWPWAIVAALGLLAVEWFVYVRRAGR